MNQYLDRKEAGLTLAALLKAYAHRDDVLVLALPRGGVPVAFEIAKALALPLDVFIVRKLGVPGHDELAMGAIAMGDVVVFNEEIIDELNIDETDIQAVIAKESKELKRREQAYRGHRPFPSLVNKTVLLIDDGIATGATMRAAITALYALNAKQIVIAVPVADQSVCEQMQSLAMEVVCPLQPTSLQAVGKWYEDFSQTEDEEVYALLNQINKKESI